MAQNNKTESDRCPQDNFPFPRCLPGHCKAKDRPQFGLECAKRKKTTNLSNTSQQKQKASVPVKVTDTYP